MHRTACPYCNAASDHDAQPARVTCPRCGEAFAPRAWTEVEATAAGAPPAAKSSRLLPILMAIIACWAAAGVVYYFTNPMAVPQDPAPAPPKVAATVPPTALKAFALLPTGNVAFAVQPAALSVYAGRKNMDVATLLKDAGVPPKVLAAVAAARLKWDDVEVLAGTVNLAGDNILPGYAAVLVLRTPAADEGKFLAAFKAQKKPKAGKATYTADVGLPVDLQKFDDRTWLFGTDAGFAAAEKGGGALTASVKEVLQTKLSPAAVAWAATADEDWSKLPAVKLLIPKEKLPAFAAGRQAAAGISLEPEPRLKVAVKLADAAAAEKLRAWFKEQLPAATVGGAGEWAEVDAPFDPAALKKLSP